MRSALYMSKKMEARTLETLRPAFRDAKSLRQARPVRPNGMGTTAITATTAIST